MNYLFKVDAINLLKIHDCNFVEVSYRSTCIARNHIQYEGIKRYCWDQLDKLNCIVETFYLFVYR